VNAVFTAKTFQDWEQSGKTPADVEAIVKAYKSSADFTDALEADEYFNGDNTKVMAKTIMTLDSYTDEKGKVIATDMELVGNRISSNFFFRFVVQQNQHLLGNGLILTGDKDKAQKKRLGMDFDNMLQELGESALTHGVSFGFWNLDHMEQLLAVVDANSGFAPLYDEETGELKAGIQFWQITSDKPTYYRMFDVDGYTRYIKENGKAIMPMTDENGLPIPKRAYVVSKVVDGLGEKVTGEKNYGRLPIVPLYANRKRRSELTANIKTKIDLYDRIQSDFGDNLDRTNDVYWVLNNFGGNRDDVIAMLAEIKRLKATYTEATGTGPGTTAEPHTIEVPYEARKTAMDLLKAALYQDYMALDMDEITGGSLTNVAIQAAMKNLNLKCDRYEWQVRKFCQTILALAGIKTDQITFIRDTLESELETVQALYLASADLTLKERLKLNPMIPDEDIEGIIADKEAEDASGLDSIDELQTQIDEMAKANATANAQPVAEQPTEQPANEEQAVQ
jgi:hypothetical protein